MVRNAEQFSETQEYAYIFNNYYDGEVETYSLMIAKRNAQLGSMFPQWGNIRKGF